MGGKPENFLEQISSEDQSPGYGDSPEWLRSDRLCRQLVESAIPRVQSLIRGEVRHPAFNFIDHWGAVRGGEAAMADCPSEGSNLVEAARSSVEDMGFSIPEDPIEAAIAVFRLAFQHPEISSEWIFDRSGFRRWFHALEHHDVEWSEVDYLAAGVFANHRLQRKFGETLIRGILGRMCEADLLAALEAMVSERLHAAAEVLEGEMTRTAFGSKPEETVIIEDPPVTWRKSSTKMNDLRDEIGRMTEAASSSKKGSLKGVRLWVKEQELLDMEAQAGFELSDVGRGEIPINLTFNTSSPEEEDFFRFAEEHVAASLGGHHRLTARARSLAMKRAASAVRVGFDLIDSLRSGSRGIRIFGSGRFDLGEERGSASSLLRDYLSLVVAGARSPGPLARDRKASKKRRSEIAGRIMLSSSLAASVGRGGSVISRFIMLVTALECLVSTSKGEVGESVAKNVAFLLEPDATRRMDAVNHVKTLYDQRSRVVHGEVDHLPEKILTGARILVAATGLSLLERARFLARLGYGPDVLLVEDLLNQYRTFGVTGGFDTTPAGMAAGHITVNQPARALWNESAGDEFGQDVLQQLRS